MPDPTNDLRSHALHQKSKEPPDVPRITAEEAAVLRLHSIPFNHYYAMRHAENRDLLDLRSGSLTPLGRAALARYEAEREREIRKPLEDLIRKLQDRCGSVSCAGCEGMWQEPHGPYQHKPGCPIDAICRSEVQP